MERGRALMAAQLVVRGGGRSHLWPIDRSMRGSAASSQAAAAQTNVNSAVNLCTQPWTNQARRQFGCCDLPFPTSRIRVLILITPRSGRSSELAHTTGAQFGSVSKSAESCSGLRCDTVYTSKPFHATVYRDVCSVRGVEQ